MAAGGVWEVGLGRSGRGGWAQGVETEPAGQRWGACYRKGGWGFADPQGPGWWGPQPRWIATGSLTEPPTPSFCLFVEQKRGTLCAGAGEIALPGETQAYADPSQQETAESRLWLSAAMGRAQEHPRTWGSGRREGSRGCARRQLPDPAPAARPPLQDPPGAAVQRAPAAVW